MMVLTSAVLMSSVYLGTIETARQQEVVTSQELATLLGHRQGVIQYVFDHRASLVEGKALTTTDLVAKGVLGLSDQWSAYWDGKQFLYFYPVNGSANSEMLTELRKVVGYTMFLGKRGVDKDGRLKLDSEQSNSIAVRLPDQPPKDLTTLVSNGSMIWAVPLPLQ